MLGFRTCKRKLLLHGLIFRTGVATGNDGHGSGHSDISPTDSGHTLHKPPREGGHSHSKVDI